MKSKLVTLSHLDLSCQDMGNHRRVTLIRSTGNTHAIKKRNIPVHELFLRAVWTTRVF